MKVAVQNDVVRPPLHPLADFTRLGITNLDVLEPTEREVVTILVAGIAGDPDRRAQRALDDVGIHGHLTAALV